jgi:hypothetical protein
MAGSPIPNRSMQVACLNPRSFSGLALVAALGFLISSCQPKDERLQGARSGGPRGSTTGQDLAEGFPARDLEYAQAMLMEVQESARQIELVLSADSAAAAPVLPACAKLSVSTGVGASRKIIRSQTNCEQEGQAFRGRRSGREFTFVTPLQRTPEITTEAAAVATHDLEQILFEGKALSYELTPKANAKDSLRMKVFRYINAEFIRGDAEQAVYKFWTETHINYNLDLKTMTDLGDLKIEVSGQLKYDRASRRVVSYFREDQQGGFNVQVESRRRPRSQGRGVDQEFRATGRSDLLNLVDCSLPEGVVNTRFTVRKRAQRGETVPFSTDVSSEIEVRAGELRKADGESSRTTKACLTSGEPNWVDQFDGLLY